MGSSLPDPDPAALERAARLSVRLRERIAQRGGVLPFDQFMHIALYEPGLGYYAAAEGVFGRDGDFVTAPESGALFAACIARQCAEILPAAGRDIVEYGAGSGRFAVALLQALQAMDACPDRYLIVEPSAGLAARQRAQLAGLIETRTVHFEWYEEHPAPGVRGVVIANEVLDAMAVKRYTIQDGRAFELGVSVRGDGFGWSTSPVAGSELDLPGDARAACAGLPDGYVSEFNPALVSWLGRLHAMLARGVVLLCDYGYPAHEYLHPGRAAGTLKCHFRHHVHDDPFWHPGVQDITAAVDFTAVAEAAMAVGFTLAGYVSQTRFLLACGLHEMLATPMADGVRQYARAQEAKLLLLPQEMGENCKFMALARDFGGALSGFRQDERQRLAAFAR